MNVLERDNMAGWRQRGQHARIHLQEVRQVLPPLPQGRLLPDQTFLDFGLGVQPQWIIHMDQNLVKDDCQSAHLHEAGRRVRSDGRVFHTVWVGDAERRPHLIFVGVVDYVDLSV